MLDFRAVPAAAILALSLSIGVAAVQDEPATFAMADIHGNYRSMVDLLEQVGLIDAQQAWAGGESTFIQTGDYTDRGPEVRRAMDLLRALERDAPEGRVRVLLGNHELMNMMGDLRDTTEADYESFRDEDSEDRRREAFEEYQAFETRRLERLGLPRLAEGAREEWLRTHPPGFVERREAFSPEGEYGEWLRELPVVVEHERTLFMHAGIHPGLAELSVDEINERVRGEIRAFDDYVTYFAEAEVILPFFTFTEIVTAVEEELGALEAGRISSEDDHRRVLEEFLRIGRWLSVHPEGALWFRGFAQWTDEEGVPLIEQLLDRYDVERFVVGHTPQAGGTIRSRFGGRIYLADTGMLSSVYQGGQASMLRIQNGAFESIYLDPVSAEEPVVRDSVN